MKFDWTITLGSIVTLIGFVASIVATYYAVLRDTDRRFAELITKFEEKFNGLNQQLTKLLEGDVRELRGRLVALESGQSEWTRTIRERTHELANIQQSILLRVDRLERPRAIRTRGSDGNNGES